MTFTIWARLIRMSQEIGFQLNREIVVEMGSFDSNYKERRIRLLQHLKGGVAVIPSGNLKTRSHDTEFPFRQESIFKYFTGFSEPESIFVVTPGQEQHFHLFVRPKDEKMELWTGKRMGVEKAKELLEMDQVYPIDSFREKIVDLMTGHKSLHCDLFGSESELADLLKAVKKCQMKNRKNAVSAPHGVSDIRHITKQMRLIKDPHEIQLMKKAASITGKAHRAAMAFTKPEVNESQVAALLEYQSKMEGAQGMAYESIVAGGDNANTLHYIANNQVLKDGDLLLIDAGAEFNLYASDVTRTFPINGKFTGIQSDVYQLVLDSQKACINMSKPGKSLKAMHEEACKVLVQGLIDLKVLEGSVDQNMEEGSFREYYPHSTSHWLGMDVHDECHYTDDKNNEITFSEGMVFTIEPGLYFPRTDKTIRSELQGIGIRIEDDILITKNGHENLTSHIPKEIKEIEEACKQELSDLQ